MFTGVLSLKPGLRAFAGLLEEAIDEAFDAETIEEEEAADAEVEKARACAEV